MAAIKKNTQARLEELRGSYLEQLDGVRDSFKYYYHLLALNELNAAGLGQLNRLAHKVAGSGGSYGFPKLSTTARRVEQLSEGNSVPHGLRHALRAAIDEIDHLQEEHAEAVQAAEAMEREALARPVQMGGWGTRVAADPAPQAEARRRSVLIVEDDPLTANLLKSLMQGEIDVSVAPDGRSVGSMIKARRPDLIVMDDQLPGVSGMRILEALKANKGLKDVPVIMLTATTDPATVDKAIKAGAVDYFTKPFEPVAFVDHIRGVLARGAAEQAAAEAAAAPPPEAAQPSEVPSAPTAAAPAPAAQVSAERGEIAPTDALGRTVLLVDDDPTIRKLLRSKFAPLGIRVLEAENGMEALATVRDHNPPPDAIILDRQMPGLDGGEVLYQLRRDPRTRKTPVIILTTRTGASDALDWLRRGAMDFVSKPFNPEEVALRAMRAMGFEPDAQ